MFFDGQSGARSHVNLGGQGGRTRARGEESRSDFVKRQQKEREARERKRLREKAATHLQKTFRSYRCLKAARQAERQVFDKRGADISKVGPLLPPEQKAKFVFLALLPMLRLFAFFFTVQGGDAARMAMLRDLVMFSAGQAAAATNVVALALSDDEAQRRSFLVLFQKLLAAALRLGPALEAVQLFHALKHALFEGADCRPVHPQRSGAAVAQLLRRTELLAVLSRDVIPRVPAADVQAAGQAAELVLMSCAGLEALSWSDRQEPLVCLLSTPRIVDLLCAGPSELCQRCLPRLLALCPRCPEGSITFPGLAEVVEGAPRSSWLLRNLAGILERHLIPLGDAAVQSTALWMTWLCWAKERVGADSHGALDRLYSPVFVRKLVQAVGNQDSDALLSFCQLYFSTVGGAGEPPVEVLQTLAFATPLAARLLPTVVGLMRGRSLDGAYEALGPPSFATPEATLLRIFCSVYALQMQPMYDYEFFGAANPLKLEEVQVMTQFLNRLAYHLVVTSPNKAAMEPSARALRGSITSLVCLLYNRHCRRPILGASGWIIADSRLLIRGAPVVDLGSDEAIEGEAGAAANEDEDQAMDVEEPPGAMMDADSPFARRPRAATGAGAGAAAGASGAPSASSAMAKARAALEAVLEEIPHVLPFTDRVELLHNVIQDDQAQRRDTRGPWAQAAMHRQSIRRNFLVEDGFAAFERLTHEGGLRDVFRVEFIDENGEPESGVDGGGLFKEFMVTLNRAMFDPDFGMFCESTDRSLYPSPVAYRTHERAGDLFEFLGKVVGKAMYEMFLLEAQFSRVFLNRLLGRLNEVDDVAALDADLHRGMLRIKEDAENVDQLGLHFSVSVSEQGFHEEVDLIPNGRNVPVTKDNLTKYFHLFANYKTNAQFKSPTASFLQGLQQVIPLAWLKMFDPYELNLLISGSNQGFDVTDLKRHTNLSGGYQADSPVILWLWDLLEHHMSPEDMGRFLMFTTSCSRPPLLGFKVLHPAFCVHRVPDGYRLPTASTCANLLKLPDYASPEVLKTKLLQAIRAEAGFDLS